MAATANGTITDQSNCAVAPRAISEVAELMATTTSEVPTAIGIGRPRTRTSAGTMTNPPPTPKNPVRKPTPRPAPTTSGQRPQREHWATTRSWSTRAVCSEGGAPTVTGTGADAGRVAATGRSIATAAAVISSENPSRSTLPSTAWLRCDPSQAAGIPAAPKNSPVRQATVPERTWLAAPVTAAAPTITRLLVVACAADCPAMNTSAGTVRIAPPPPRPPSTSPIASPRTASHSTLISGRRLPRGSAPGRPTPRQAPRRRG